MESKAQISLKVGQRLIVDIEKIAHGGHFIARHESESGKKAVIFVRHAIPGEKVEIEIQVRVRTLFAQMLLMSLHLVQIAS